MHEPLHSEIGNEIVIDGGRLSIDDVIDVACRGRRVSISSAPAFCARIDAGPAFLDRLIREGEEVYGVNTGYGDSCTVRIPPHLMAELPLHLIRFHGCGMGEILEEETTLAVLLARLNSLAQGYSGVRRELLQGLAALINHRILPLIPAEGSVGASGDLTPLSYVAAVLVGEREVLYQGQPRTASEALLAAGLSPLKLGPKEGLALMNGTSVMTGMACLAWPRAEYLTRLCARLTAMAVASLQGNRSHFDPRFFRAKPHAGQNEVVGWIYGDLGELKEANNLDRIQDRYSIRCAPHVIGVLRDALTWMQRDIENELNSANDNPLIDGERELVFHGGHFYGGHIAFVMDGMKAVVANLADLMDRQFALLVDARFNNGLPQNLSGAGGERKPLNHGFKAVQIATSAWAAEALKLTMPASVFSRSTECHNQDKVSMGTIAARDCLRVLELTEQVAAALLLGVCQALELRRRQDEASLARLSVAAKEFFELARRDLPFVEEDMPLDKTLHSIVRAIGSRGWRFYP